MFFRGSADPQVRETAPAQIMLEAQVEREAIMFVALAVALLILWGVGLATSYTIGGVIHVLLVGAVLVVVVRLIQARRTP